MTVTLRQLADELELSTATVSLALRGSERIAVRTRDRVQALAERYDYVQSNFGRALQSRRSGLIGMLLPQLTYSFYGELLSGAGDASINSDYNLLIGWAIQNDRTCSKQIQMLLEKEIDALVIAFVAPEIEKGIERFRRRSKPVVYCNCNLPAPEGSSWVYNDDVLGGRIAVRALCAAGHRHILCSNRRLERLKGNRLEAAEWGASVTEFHKADEAMEALRRDPRLTGIAAFGDEECMETFFPALAEAGFRIPQDISIIGFDGIPRGGRSEFQLTTVGQERSLLGKRAVEVALRLLADPESGPIQELLKPWLLERKTIAPPGRKA